MLSLTSQSVIISHLYSNIVIISPLYSTIVITPISVVTHQPVCWSLCAATEKPKRLPGSPWNTAACPGARLKPLTAAPSRGASRAERSLMSRVTCHELSQNIEQPVLTLGHNVDQQESLTRCGSAAGSELFFLCQEKAPGRHPGHVVTAPTLRHFQALALRLKIYTYFKQF